MEASPSFIALPILDWNKQIKAGLSYADAVTAECRRGGVSASIEAGLRRYAFESLTGLPLVTEHGEGFDFHTQQVIAAGGFPEKKVRS